MDEAPALTRAIGMSCTPAQLHAGDSTGSDSAGVACAATITEPQTAARVTPATGDGDHDRFAHYVRKADTVRAYVEGTPIRALCGKVWVPSRDPSRYPLCPTCAEIMRAMLSGDRG